MAKILLVEDDKSLREIYGVRLMAEGYEIVSAGDGEEALAMAIKERPDLIVSDVMMPKISGFDMLDILRSTSETKDVKVIMMTALSSEDQRARGEALGADRYLVKSQVGIEDVVRTVHDVLGDSVAAPAPAAAPVFTPAATPVPAAPAPDAPPVFAAAPTPTPAPAPVAPPAPVVDTPTPAPAPAPAIEVLTSTPAPAVPVFDTPAPAPVAPEPVVAPVAPATQAPEPLAPAPAAPSFAAPTPTLAPAPAPAVPVFDTPAPAPVAPAPVAAPTPEPAMPQPTAPFSTPAPASLAERVIQPLVAPTDQAQTLDIAAQMEQALNGMPAPAAPTPADPMAQPPAPAPVTPQTPPTGLPPVPPLS